MRAYISGNGPSVIGWVPGSPLYATNKYPPWLSPDVYAIVSRHATVEWGDDIRARMKRVAESGGKVFVGESLKNQTEYSGCVFEYIGVDKTASWHKNGLYGIGSGSLFPLIQMAILDGATEIEMAGIDGYTGVTCADDNHYDKDYFVAARRKPSVENVNALNAYGHKVAGRVCKKTGIPVTIIGNSMFKDYYK